MFVARNLPVSELAVSTYFTGNLLGTHNTTDDKSLCKVDYRYI